MSNTELPNVNPSWPESGATSEPVPPKQIRLAYWLIMAAALFQIIASIFVIAYLKSAGYRDSLTSSLAARSALEPGRDLVEISVSTSVGFAIGSMICGVIAYILLGAFIKKGRSWARLMAAILAVLSMGEVAKMLMPGGIFTVLQVAAGVVAMVLCYIRPGSGYFTAMKEYRAANKVR